MEKIKLLNQVVHIYFSQTVKKGHGLVVILKLLI